MKSPYPTSADQARTTNGSAPGVDNHQDVDYDIVVIGGAFAGSAFAVLLNRWLPNRRVLIIERRQEFEKKVGEATVELSGYFLHHVLGLYDHLSRHHLPKHGLRYWFHDGTDRPLSELTEVGPSEVPHLPSFQLDRPVLDEHLLTTAAEEGCEVLRPAKVLAMDLGWPRSEVRVQTAGEELTISARWLIDASGRQAFIGRKLGLQQRVDKHPTAAMWARWDGVADMDGTTIGGEDVRSPALPNSGASRRLATNHFSGYGWWIWVIPQANGKTSIGFVYNKELFTPPADGSLRQRYEQIIRTTPGLSQLLSEASIDGDDFMALSHLPYSTERYMDKGWAMVGDAASFIDPYYSPGLDHAAISVWATARLVERDLAGGLDEQQLNEAVDVHNDAFVRSYHQWLGALYEGKYELMGDVDLLSCAFLMDTASYYAAVVTPIVRDDIDLLSNPMFGPPIAPVRYAYKLTRWFNQRLMKLARFRRLAGTYGKNNVGQRRLKRGFSLGRRSALRPALSSIRLWWGVEFEYLIYRLRHGRVDLSQPIPESAGASVPVANAAQPIAQSS